MEAVTPEMYPILHNDTFLLANDQKGMRHDLTDGYLYTFFEFTDNMKIRYIDVTEPTLSLELVKRGAGILVMITLYVLSGPVVWLCGKIVGRRLRPLEDE